LLHLLAELLLALAVLRQPLLLILLAFWSTPIPVAAPLFLGRGLGVAVLFAPLLVGQLAGTILLPSLLVGLLLLPAHPLLLHAVLLSTLLVRLLLLLAHPLLLHAVLLATLLVGLLLAHAVLLGAISLRAVLVAARLLRLPVLLALRLPLGSRLLPVRGLLGPAGFRLRLVLGLLVPLVLASLLVVLRLRIARSGNPHKEKQNCRAFHPS
jgi:hypothetical protein